MLTKDDFIIRVFKNCIHLASRDIGGIACGVNLSERWHPFQ